MSKSKQLYELQETDLEIEHKTETLVQIESQLGKDDNLVAARNALEVARKQLVDLEHQQRNAEWKVDELGTKIAAEEKKLYEGSVKNPRELMSLQHETELLKAQHGEREEQLLAVMMEVDAAQKDVAAKHSELETMEKEWQEDQERLSREKTELEADSVKLTQSRESLRSLIDSDSLKAYDELRYAKQGLAVAKLVQGRCQGCRISLPMSDQQKARMGHKLATCSNCGRILYMD